MAAQHLIQEYPVGLEIISGWLKSGAIGLLEKNDDVFQILFPRLDLLTGEDIKQLRRNTPFLQQVAQAFPLVMQYYGLYFDGTDLTIVGRLRFWYLFVYGSSSASPDQTRPEHLRLAQIMRFLHAVQLEFQYLALRDLAIQFATLYTQYIPASTLQLWRDS